MSKSYAIVDTGQSSCFDSASGVVVACAGTGHDADYAGNPPSYRLSDDGLTVADGVTGLVWRQSSDVDGDGDLDYDDKLFQDEAVGYCADLILSGRSDWRLPSIKELYSLIRFDGTTGMSADESMPYIDTDYFVFSYGDTSAGERFIDSQYLSSTL